MTIAETRADAPRLPQLMAAGAVGNVLEWFDFAVYGYFAMHIGQVFFPKSNAAAQLIAAFGIFAIGYLARPLGGVLIGHVGDRLGRKTAMTISVGAMAIPTFLMGVLPGYDTLGLLAPILLTFLRMVQGLSVGGEYTTSLIFMVEHAPRHRRCLAGATAVSGAIIGILMGSAASALLAAALSPAALAEWGWRLPFLSGLVIGLAGLFLRRHVPDGEPNRDASAPLTQVLRHHRKPVALVAALCLINAVGFQIVFVYLVSWLQTVDRLSAAAALEINTASMALFLAMIFAGGALADRIGSRIVMAACALGLVLLSVPLFQFMAHPQTSVILASQMVFAVLLGLYIGAQPAFIVLHSPPRVRCTALAIGYNLTLGLVGGLSPLVAASLIGGFGDSSAPGYMIAALSAVSLAALIVFARDPEEAIAG